MTGKYLTAAELFKDPEVKYSLCFKYIRMESGEFRFVNIESHRDHASMVSEGEKVVSGGMIVLKTDRFCYRGYGSHTCRVSWSNEDTELLEKALGVNEVSEYDF